MCRDRCRIRRSRAMLRRLRADDVELELPVRTPFRTVRVVCGHPRAPARRRRAREVATRRGPYPQTRRDPRLRRDGRDRGRRRPAGAPRACGAGRGPRSSSAPNRASDGFRVAAPVVAHERGEERDLGRARSRGARRSRRGTRRAGGGPCARRVGRRRAAAPRTRASRGRASSSPCSSIGLVEQAQREAARRASVCAASELQRRARLATAARRSARGSSDQSSDRGCAPRRARCPRAAPSRSTVKPSSSNRSSAVTSSVEPAGQQLGPPLLLEPGHAAGAPTSSPRMMRSCSASSSARVARNALVLAGSVVVAGAQRDRHAHEVVERAARADRHPRARGRAPRRRAASSAAAYALVEALAVGARRRVVVHALGGEAADAEREARRPAQPGGVADHDLDAAAADVDAERGRGLEHDARPHRGEDRAGPPRGR